MDLCSTLFTTFVMMLILLGAARCSNGDEQDCSCPKIPQKNLTEPPSTKCFSINDAFRYTCIEGYLRKAGTSSLTKCQKTYSGAKWTSPSLQCIPDPRRTNTETTTKRVTKGPTDIPPDSIIATTVIPGNVNAVKTSIQQDSPNHTAASTSPQMTLSISSSVSVTAETESAEPTSPGLQVLSDHSQGFVSGTQATDWTTSASITTGPSDSRTVNPHISDPQISRAITATIALASLVFITALIGMSCFFHRRRSRRNTTENLTEEQIPMNGPSPQELQTRNIIKH